MCVQLGLWMGIGLMVGLEFDVSTIYLYIIHVYPYYLVLLLDAVVQPVERECAPQRLHLPHAKGDLS